METSKFEKCIRLTESSNDHEALSALRIAQGLCKKYKMSFVDYLLKQGQTRHREIEYLKLNFAQITDKYERLALKCAELYKENIKLKKKLEVFQGTESLQEKYKKLKEEYENTGQRNKLILCQLEIFQEVYECAPSEKEDVLCKLLTNYIKKFGIKYSKNEWKSSIELYKEFIEKVCFNVNIISPKKFSQMFALQLDVKSVKGGKKKDKMGFPVCINPHRIFTQGVLKVR